MRSEVNVRSVCEGRGHAECAWVSDAINAFLTQSTYSWRNRRISRRNWRKFCDAIDAFRDATTHFTTHFATQSTHFTTQSTHFTTQSTHFTTQSTHFATQLTHFTTQSTHLMTHKLEQKQIKALSSYTFHHLNANLEGNNKYTIDMGNIHTCATCGKIFRRKYDLRRHENTVHSEDTSSRRGWRFQIGRF